MAICGNCFNNIPDNSACPICGYDGAREKKKYASALPAGTVLNRRFFVGRVLGEGGFGITYLAQDYASKQRVAIKEYFPTEFIARDKNTDYVQLHSSDRAESFETGKQQFLAEARTLAEFIGDEHIVRIYRYFEENDTAYFAMEYVQGQALNKYMEENRKLFTVEEANDIFLPLMDSLANVHAKGIVHRDISPDNIIIQPDGSAKLIDFGAARYSTGEMSKSLDVVLKHGFAPPEQYTRRSRQGPFTDVYALAATYYFAITSRIPPDAVDRVVEDTLIPPSKENPEINKRLDPVLTKALAPNYKDRYQTMTDFRDALDNLSDQKAVGKRRPEERSSKKRRTSAILTGILLLALIGGGVLGSRMLKKNSAIPEESPTPLDPGQETVTEESGETEEITQPDEPATGTQQTEIPEELSEPNAFETVGNVVLFGSYEQDNDLTNGQEPIEWIVLDVQDGKSLLISEYVLDGKRFHDTERDVCWETCSLRTWLNGTFLEAAFNKEELDCIPANAVSPDKNPQRNTDQGNVTQDRVFLLSALEADEYFQYDAERACQPTKYAVANGCQNGMFIPWWLRTSGYDSTSAAQVEMNGTISYMGAIVNSQIHDMIEGKSYHFGVRPAIRVDTEKAASLAAAPEEENTGEIGKVGSIVAFGTYEQDNNLENGAEPIEWLVLDVREEKSLLISLNGIDCQVFHNRKFQPVNWEKCTLRAWLNEDFLVSAFSEKERARIITSTVSADTNPDYDIDPGNDTQDELFLLSLPEAEKYFASDKDMVCHPTAYAIVQGCYDDAGNTTGNCLWWLRTPGYQAYCSVAITLDGEIFTKGASTTNPQIAVRPALWIDLAS